MDAGFYNEAGDPELDLGVVEVSRFTTYVAAPPGLVSSTEPLDWRLLAEQPWIYPTASACCGRTAEGIFKVQQFRPKRIISVDRETANGSPIARNSMKTITQIGANIFHSGVAEDAGLARLGEGASALIVSNVVC